MRTEGHKLFSNSSSLSHAVVDLNGVSLITGITSAFYLKLKMFQVFSSIAPNQISELFSKSSRSTRARNQLISIVFYLHLKLTILDYISNRRSTSGFALPFLYVNNLVTLFIYNPNFVIK